MFVLDGRPLSPDVPFTTADGTQYPANWLRLATPAEREAIGIQEVEDPRPYDQRFAWGWAEDGSLIWKDHDQLLAQWSSQTKTTANTLLAPSDWMASRKADNGTPIPADWSDWREAVRLAAGEKLAALALTADSEALAAYVTSAAYTAWPADPDAPAPVAAPEPERARNPDGTFMADDPATPDVNEAYVTSGF